MCAGRRKTGAENQCTHTLQPLPRHAAWCDDGQDVDSRHARRYQEVQQVADQGQSRHLRASCRSDRWGARRRREHGVRLLCWSGQSFKARGLKKEGSFKAAEARYTSADEIDDALLEAWLAEARDVQWDYKNIVKRKGRLVRLPVTRS